VGVELKSEFAVVEVELDVSANGPRLKILDKRTGRTTYLDPLELESLAWARHQDLAPLVDPSLGRWRDDSWERLLEEEP
jgi:hypothetical protein